MFIEIFKEFEKIAKKRKILREYLQEVESKVCLLYTSENWESVGIIEVRGIAVAVPFISCRKIADSMVKSRNRDKNTT